MRRNVSSGSPFEAPIGFSRAVRIGPMVCVAGTAPIVDGKTAHPGDLYGQTRACLDIILRALAEAGAGPDDVIRTRVFLRDVAAWREAGRAHGDVFGAIKPACTFVGAALIDPDWLVEIEADAFLSLRHEDRERPR
jgi:enamine deaminase RidA (YjgF/YER057c/UK114 family)